MLEKFMRRKVIGIALSAVLYALCGSADAQQAAKVPRIGYLTGTSAPTITTPDLNADSFRQGLRDLGYIEGENIQVEYRYADRQTDRPDDSTECAGKGG